MSERQRRKDDTWTKDELTEVLHKQKEKSHRINKTKSLEGQTGVSDRYKSIKSSRHAENEFELEAEKKQRRYKDAIDSRQNDRRSAEHREHKQSRKSKHEAADGDVLRKDKHSRKREDDPGNVKGKSRSEKDPEKYRSLHRSGEDYDEQKAVIMEADDAAREKHKLREEKERRRKEKEERRKEREAAHTSGQSNKPEDDDRENKEKRREEREREKQRRRESKAAEADNASSRDEERRKRREDRSEVSVDDKSSKDEERRRRREERREASSHEGRKAKDEDRQRRREERTETDDVQGSKSRLEDGQSNSKDGRAKESSSKSPVQDLRHQEEKENRRREKEKRREEREREKQQRKRDGESEIADKSRTKERSSKPSEPETSDSVRVEKTIRERSLSPDGDNVAAKPKRPERKKSRRKSEKIAEEAYDYDDDFEDYDEDFEDEEEETSDMKVIPPHMREVIEAINKENERVASSHSSSRSRPDSDRHRGASTQPPTTDDEDSISVSTKINFGIAKKNQKANKITKKLLARKDDLLSLIQLDFISFDLFDLAPVTEYAFYMQNFGNKNARQVATQCNDDALDVDIQTDDVDLLDKWTQHPQDGAFASGGGHGARGDEVNTYEQKQARIKSILEVDSRHFASFVDYAVSVAEVAFDEAALVRGVTAGGRSELSSCETCTDYNANLSYLQGREVQHCVYADGRLVLAFGPSRQQVQTRLDRRGIITVWKASDCEQPRKILACDATPTVCFFAPTKRDALFVGTDDGSLLVYDLSEPSSMHQVLDIEKSKSTVMRCPTYTTGWMLDVHSSPVVAANVVSDFVSSNQVFTVEESARICVWVVIELLMDVVDDDIGLVPHGRLKLDRSVTINSNKFRMGSGDFRATCGACPDSNVFYLGTDTGAVLSFSRTHKLKKYGSEGVGRGVSDIAFNSFNRLLLLVGYNDGSLTLFHVNRASPAMTWSLQSACLLCCDWSNCRPSVFYSLATPNRLDVFDLLAVDTAPATDLIKQPVKKMCVEKREGINTTDLMLAFDAGSFQVHRVASHLSAVAANDESDQLMALVTSFA